MTNAQPFLILSRAEIERLISLADAIETVEKAFCALARGEAFLFPVIRERIDPNGGFFGVKAGYLASQGYLGYKGGGFWASNRRKGIAGHQSVILLYDPATGIPKAAMDGNYLTVIRTGAVGALAARVLARKDSRIAAIAGAGAQGAIQLAALRAVLPIAEIRCYDRDAAAAAAFVQSASSDGLRATATRTAQEAIAGADVIVTATPSFEPFVQAQWIAPGMHISAFGADTRGKQELEAELMPRSKVVVDYLAQACEIGEIQHAFRQGLIGGVHAELGEILTGAKPGRESAEEITLFDATGIALQDLAVAGRAYELAIEQGVGTSVVLD
jgi:alanine dehydrogenase